jgi:tripartite-type tricarboxylate transporter receptor subunit TctC
MGIGKRCAISVAIMLVLCVPFGVHAQEKPAGYPRKPIRVVVGIAPGSGLDLMSRLGAQKITERWNQSVIVDNRAGGGTVIAMDVAAQAPADGYTLLAASETLMLNGVFGRARYDVRKAFVPIVQLTTQPYALIVHPSVPAKSVKELIAYAKAKPGALNFGSQGHGTVGHIGLERFKLMAGVEITHVAYKGAAPALLDLLAGQVQMTFSTLVTSGAHIRSGRVRALAYTGARRSSLYPDLPTVSEAGVPGFEMHNTYGYFAPAGTSRAIVRVINAVVTQGMNTPETAKMLALDGNEIVPAMTPEELKVKFDRDYADLEKLIRAMNITIN